MENPLKKVCAMKRSLPATIHSTLIRTVRTGSRSIVVIRRKHPDVREISGQTVKIKTVADNEIGRNLEADIVGLHRGLK